MGARILAFDTSTEMLCVGVSADGHRHTLTEVGGAKASVRLLPAAMELLARCGLALAELDAVAFGRGPGAFTGLRTACAVAQGLALGANKPVLAIDSLLIVAEDVVGASDDIWVAMDARMDEAYVAHYRRVAPRDGSCPRWQTLRAGALFTLPALTALWRLDPPAQVAGSALQAYGDRLSCGHAHRHTRSHDRAAALLRLAEVALEDGAGVDAALALPVYVRDKVALTTAERLTQRELKLDRVR
jgi:tRNA threonylcarbamoyladenosine biosynthesis protein TsaB